LRVLLDVNILVRANERSQGPARELLYAVISQHSLLISDDMLAELSRVLRYPRLQRLYGLSDDDIYRYVQLLREAGENVIPNTALAVPMRDPKDVVVLQAAISGDADVICTLDTDFYDEETRAHCTVLGIDIFTDTELLRRIRGG